MREPTRREIEVLTMIAAYRGGEGCSPTIREIAERLGCNSSTAHGHTVALRELGLLTSAAPGRSRQLVPTSLGMARVNRINGGHSAHAWQSRPTMTA